MISVKLLKEQPNARRYVNDNEEMVKQTRQSRKAPFKIDDMVAIKIDRVEKTSPVHPNMLLGKIMEIRKDYAKIVTLQGSIKIICLHFEECDSPLLQRNFVHGCLQAS